MMKAVIVDDEVLAIGLLEAMLAEIGEIEVIGKFLNPLECIENLSSLKPDVLFLDIEMQEMNGIQLAKALGDSSLEMDIIFVTAYDHYALQAFDVHALDYILKPIEKERLRKTVNRIQKKKPIGTLEAKNAGLTAHYFGSFQFYYGEHKRLKWRTKKVKELCAYLLYAGQPVHKDKLMEDLWPDLSVEKASSLLHTNMYYLRKELKNQGYPEGVHYVNERYSLTIDITSDYQQVRTILNEGLLTEQQVEMLLDVYRGEFLAEEDYCWSLHEREYLRKEIVHYLQNYIDSRSREIQPSMMKRVIEKLIEMDPWEERYTILSIQYDIDRGCFQGAIHTYNQYKKGIWEHLGIKPEAKLEKLIASLK